MEETTTAFKAAQFDFLLTVQTILPAIILNGITRKSFVDNIE
jgi:hypothetical protein